MNKQRQQPIVILHYDDRQVSAQPWAPPRLQAKEREEAPGQSQPDLETTGPPAAEEGTPPAKHKDEKSRSHGAEEADNGEAQATSSQAEDAERAEEVEEGVEGGEGADSTPQGDDPAGQTTTHRYVVVSGDGSQQDLFEYTPEGGLVPLTEGGQAALAVPRLSPTGGQVAYLATDGKLWVRNLDSGEALALATAGPLTAFAWSRDGRHIALDGLQIINVEKAESLPLNQPGHWPAWLPDGQHIIAAWEHRLWVINWQTGERAVVEDDLLEPRQELQVSFDGRFVAYTSPSGSASNLRIVDLPAGVAQSVDTGSDRVLHPVWAPGQNKLLFTSTHFASQEGRMVRLGRFLTAAPQEDAEAPWMTEILAESTCLQGGAARWHSDGSHISYISCGPQGESGGGVPSLYTTDPQSGGTEGGEPLVPGPVAGFDLELRPAKEMETTGRKE